MKKPSRKLELRGETLRALATLDLVRVVGGGDTGAAACGGAIQFNAVAVQYSALAGVATAVCG